MTPERVVVVIPSRYGSTRLPGKALVDLAGKPLVQHVYERARRAAGVDAVYVATDDERIRQACEAFGASAVMTPTTCASGTDRVACAVRDLDGEIVVNVQGDEPLLDPRAIDQLVEAMRAHPEDGMATLAVRPAVGDELGGPSVVKVVCNLAGYALYFSRSLVPHPRDPADVHAPVLKHLGIYAYRRAALEQFVAWPPTPLERTEKLEQLRALEHGLRIRVIETGYDSIGVDTPADAERVRELLALQATRLRSG